MDIHRVNHVNVIFLSLSLMLYLALSLLGFHRFLMLRVSEGFKLSVLCDVFQGLQFKGFSWFDDVGSTDTTLSGASCGTTSPAEQSPLCPSRWMLGLTRF